VTSFLSSDRNNSDCSVHTTTTHAGRQTMAHQEVSFSHGQLTPRSQHRSSAHCSPTASPNHTYGTADITNNLKHAGSPTKSTSPRHHPAPHYPTLVQSSAPAASTSTKRDGQGLVLGIPPLSVSGAGQLSQLAVCLAATRTFCLLGHHPALPDQRNNWQGSKLAPN
jgi:hypothetical protein